MPECPVKQTWPSGEGEGRRAQEEGGEAGALVAQF